MTAARGSLYLLTGGQDADFDGTEQDVTDATFDGLEGELHAASLDFTLGAAHGRLRYAGEDPITAQIRVSLSASSQTVPARNLVWSLAKNGVAIAGSEIGASLYEFLGQQNYDLAHLVELAAGDELGVRVRADDALDLVVQQLVITANADPTISAAPVVPLTKELELRLIDAAIAKILERGQTWSVALPSGGTDALTRAHLATLYARKRVLEGLAAREASTGSTGIRTRYLTPED